MSALARQPGRNAKLCDEASDKDAAVANHGANKEKCFVGFCGSKIRWSIGAPILLAEFDVSGGTAPLPIDRADLSREGAKVRSRTWKLAKCARRPGEKDSKSSQEVFWGFGIALIKMESFRYLPSMISQNYEENPPLGRLGFVTFLFASK